MNILGNTICLIAITDTFEYLISMYYIDLNTVDHIHIQTIRFHTSPVYHLYNTGITKKYTHMCY